MLRQTHLVYPQITEEPAPRIRPRGHCVRQHPRPRVPILQANLSEAHLGWSTPWESRVTPWESRETWTPWTRNEDLYLLKYVGYQIPAKHIMELLYIRGISVRKRTLSAVEKRARFLRRKLNFNSKSGRLDDPFYVFFFLSQHFKKWDLSLSSQPERLLIKVIKGKPH